MNKPSDQSISRAQGCAEAIADLAGSAVRHLYAARRLFRLDCAKASVTDLRLARECLVTLRRTQTAALANIDAAIASAKQPTE